MPDYANQQEGGVGMRDAFGSVDGSWNADHTEP
jgi:hypothetical protein